MAALSVSLPTKSTLSLPLPSTSHSSHQASPFASLSAFPPLSLSLSLPSLSPLLASRRLPSLSPHCSSSPSPSSPSDSPSPSTSPPSFASLPSILLRTPEGDLVDLPAIPGVYGLYDSTDVLQYVGLTRRLVTSIQGYARDLPDLCHSVKIFPLPSATRDSLAATWKALMESHLAYGSPLPAGNAPGNATWTALKTKALKTKADQKLTPGPHVKLTIPMVELIGKVVKEHKVVAFIKGSRTSPQCGFSHRVLTILKEQRVDFETFDVLDEHHNAGLREGIKQYSQWPTIPQVYVNGEFIGGADILEEMTTSGEIKKAFV